MKKVAVIHQDSRVLSVYEISFSGHLPKLVLRECFERLGAHVAEGTKGQRELRHRVITRSFDYGDQVVLAHGQIEVCHFGATLPGQPSGGLGAIWRVLDISDALLGVVDEHDVLGHGPLPESEWPGVLV